MKEFLSQKELPFREYNIVEDRNAFEEMWLISGQKAAPVVTIDGTVVVGFKKDRLENALDDFS
ncbi:glutaredoxin family protein [Dethiobacter alkaliphilus]|uniref:glutaredoxin family protein n=1 Tax=Dethiobacter alkaliphilus TaxID=427926 RepID=UPI002227F6D2|nr:glutaredoxin family protein [Dethiobacter alkaliphilus]MCW3490734.1 glutaredoxin family protein [Dethiobacter alkaliphilus]